MKQYSTLFQSHLSCNTKLRALIAWLSGIFPFSEACVQIKLFQNNKNEVEKHQSHCIRSNSLTVSDDKVPCFK